MGAVPRYDNGSRTPRRRLLSGLLVLWLALVVVAAAGAQPEKLKFDRLSLDQGLSQASGNAILQDARGFLWIGTQDGLNRWDGYEIEVFKRDPDDPASLLDNFVVGLRQDSDGRFWVFHSAGQGVTLLDPLRRTFRRLVHDPQDPWSLAPGARFYNPRALYEDSRGRVWLGTIGAGINLIDKETLAVKRLLPDGEDPESLAHVEINHIFEAEDGTLWIATDAGLQKRLPPAGDRERFVTYTHDAEKGSSLPDDEVTGVLEDEDGRLWVGTARGLARLDPERETWERFLTGDDYPAVTGNAGDPFVFPGLIDRRGWLWVRTREGLAVYERGEGALPGAGEEAVVFRHYLPDSSDPRSLSSPFVSDAHEDSAGDLWLGTGAGINRYREQTDDFDVFVHDPADPGSLTNDVVLDVFESRSGMMWFGTFGGGLSTFSRGKHKFTEVAREPSELADETVFTILVDRRDTLWIGTQVGGLHRFDPDRQRVVERYFFDPGGPRDLGGDFVSALVEDSSGRFWVGTGGGGLARIDRDGGRVERRYTHDPGDDASLSADNIQQLYEDRSGAFWVATAGGLDLFDREAGRFERLEHDPERPDRSLPQARIWELHEDRRDRLWLATNAGLCRLDRDTRDVACHRSDPEDPTSLSHDSVMDLWEDDAGGFWIATYGGGLNHFDPEAGTATHLTMRDGLPSDSLYSVLPDGRGHLWISSNYGLTRFDPSRREIKNFDAGDGLQSNEFNSRAFFAAPDGELFFGGISGLTRFRPEDVTASSYLPPVALTRFSTLGRRPRTLRTLEELDEVVVGYRDLVFSFEFASLDFSSPERNRYAYRLEGFDADWIDSGSRRFASYTNLDGGTYTFRVKGTNSDGVWNEDGASIRVVVIPKPWKTWWAYSLYLATAFGAVLGYVRYKTLAQEREVERHRQEAERLKQIDRMKDEFLANTSHELRTPLNGIIGISESLLDGAAGEIGRAARDNLIMVSASGRRLAHLVDDILDFSKLRNHEIVLRKRPVALRELVEVTLMLCRPLVGSRELELVNEVEADLPAVEADEDRLQQILHNLLGNAIKFTRKGLVAVSARLNDDQESAAYGADEARRRRAVEVAVADTGVGIPADKLSRIFESFEQADASSAREFGGTGLGLTITRQLVELHGGSMGVISTEGEGSTFTFTLPAAEGAEEAQDLGATSTSSQQLSRVRDIEPILLPAGPAPTAVADPASMATEAGSLAVAAGNGSGHVLCVDDEPINLQVLENLLGLEGYSIQRANDGLECLEILQQGTVPDLILLDVMMPRMTGFEVARRIRRSFSAHRLPILLVTAKNQVSDLVEGLSSGANDYLSKPFSKQELLARVRTHINLSRAHTVEAENQRKTEEMKQARAIQLSLLPEAPPEIPHLEIAAHLETATEVGGDYYDFFPQDDGGLYVVTGDATGHGISAGMMVSMTKSALKALDVQSPHVLLQQLNAVVRAVDLKRMQMALNVAYFTESEVAISSAAMPPAFLYRAGRKVAEEVLVPGLPLGALAGTEYGLVVFDLLPGDALVLLSDGLPEYLQRRGEADGYAAVGRLVERHGHGTARELLDALIALGEGEGNGSDEDRLFDDDVTIVVVKRR